MIKSILLKLARVICWIMGIGIIVILSFIMPPTLHLLRNWLIEKGLGWVYGLVIYLLFIHFVPYKIYKWYKNKKIIRTLTKWRIRR